MDDPDYMEATYVEVQSRSTSPFDERVVQVLTDQNLIENDAMAYVAEHAFVPRPPPSQFDLPIPNSLKTVNDVIHPSVDMMNSMAKLIDAVGNMVTNASDTVSAARNTQRRRTSRRNVSSAALGSQQRLLTSRELDDMIANQVRPTALRQAVVQPEAFPVTPSAAPRPAGRVELVPPRSATNVAGPRPTYQATLGKLAWCCGLIVADCLLAR